MLHVTCADLTAECDAAVAGGSVKDIVLKYVLQAAHAHRRGAVKVDDVIAAIKPSERRSARSQRAA